MKKIVLFLFITNFSTLYAQQHLIGIKGGINWANINLPTTLSDLVLHESKTGFIGGLTYEYLFKKYFSLSADVLYAQYGFLGDRGGIYSRSLSGTERSRYEYNYLSMPIKAGYRIGDKIYGFVNLGLTPSILRESSIKIDIYSYIVDPAFTRYIGSQPAQFDIAGIIELGGGCKIKSRAFLFTSLAYQQSFTTFSNDNYLAGIRPRHYGISLSVGLKYAITK